jgi:hypothetical protein
MWASTHGRKQLKTGHASILKDGKWQTCRRQLDKVTDEQFDFPRVSKITKHSENHVPYRLYNSVKNSSSIAKQNFDL